MTALDLSKARALVVDPAHIRSAGSLTDRAYGALTELPSLVREIEALRAALRPFANWCIAYESFGDNRLKSDQTAIIGAHVPSVPRSHLLLVDFREARAAIPEFQIAEGGGRCAPQSSSCAPPSDPCEGKRADAPAEVSASLPTSAPEPNHDVKRLIEACLSWAEDTGDCHFCGDWTRSAKHDPDCPIRPFALASERGA